jgi:hypothetical protein
LTREQDKVMRAVSVCRTAALGGHVDVCDSCGYTAPSYNSCRNRHCPKCQSLDQARWIDQRMTRLLPTHYFHVVFTLPSELRPLARANRALVFNLLFAAAAETLLEVGRDPKKLGAQLGITSVLHTWTRELKFHPHVHCIVTGGGLSDDGKRWVAARQRYLFSVKLLGSIFRRRFLAGLRRAYADGALRLEGNSCAPLRDRRVFQALIDRLFGISWVVYAKRPFGGPDAIFRYLGRYTHRVGISNQRLRAITPDAVRFATKEGKEVTVSPEAFMRRFLDHVLPPGFVKIRHYGLLAGANINTRLAAARALLARGAPTEPAPAPPAAASDELSWQELLAELTAIDVTRCPRCKTGRMERRPLDSDPLAATLGVIDDRGDDTS